MSKSYIKRHYFKKADISILVLVLLVAVLGFFIIFLSSAGQAPTCAEIRVNAKLVETVDLTKVIEPYEITVNGSLPVTLRISKEGVEFLESECTDKLCIHWGLIGAGESAACLPAGVSVSVKNSTPAEIDALAG